MSSQKLIKTQKGVEMPMINDNDNNYGSNNNEDTNLYEHDIKNNK